MWNMDVFRWSVCALVAVGSIVGLIVAVCNGAGNGFAVALGSLGALSLYGLVNKFIPTGLLGQLFREGTPGRRADRKKRRSD